MEEALSVRVKWTIKEKIGGRWKVVWESHNLMTDFGLTALSSAFGGTYDPPLYLVIDDYAGEIQNVGTLAVGATSVSLDKRVDIAGDTQIVLGVGTANEETVTFSAVSGTGPYVYTISATTKSHVQNDPCVRLPRQSDTVASIQSEVQYAPTVFPSKRAQRVGAGYSSGTGNHVMSFFITGSQAVGTWMSLGTSESETVGGGNLHNHLTSGYVHNSGNDTQIDVSLTLANS